MMYCTHCRTRGYPEEIEKTYKPIDSEKIKKAIDFNCPKCKFFLMSTIIDDLDEENYDYDSMPRGV